MPSEQKTPKYTTIIHEVRLQLELSCNEYCVADIIFSLSNNPASIIPGWCFASKETIGRFMGINERRVRDIIERLIIKGITEKDPVTRYLRTTSLWYNSVVLERLKMKNIITDKTSGTRTKRPVTPGRNVRSKADETSDNKNNYNNKVINKLAPPDGAGKLLNNLIDTFKAVNPSFERLFANKTERKALERMTKKHGHEKIKKVIEQLVKTNNIQYAPVITTPLQLERKLGNLIAFYQRKKAETETKGIKINTL